MLFCTWMEALSFGVLATSILAQEVEQLQGSTHLL